MHNYSCFEQSCDKSVWSCGKSKLEEYFGPLSAKLGHLKLELYQHLKEAYLKPDGSKVCFSQLKSNHYWQFFFDAQIKIYASKLIKKLYTSMYSEKSGSEF